MTENMKRKANSPGRPRNSEENNLRFYLSEIKRIPVLTKDEEEETAMLAAAGNKAAWDKLINSNLRFVIMLAKKFQGRGLPLEDLISEGNIGLLNAAKRFDAQKGCRFITYAVWWVRQAIVRAINDKGRMIRLPREKSKTLAEIEKSRQALKNKPGQESEAEIRDAAAFLEIDPEKAVGLVKISQEVLSLDEPIVKYENSVPVKDLIEDESLNSPHENATNNILKGKLERVLHNLEERAADVIRSRFGLGDSAPMTLKEIGDRYQLSRERVRQIEKRALIQLQQFSLNCKLESYIA